MTDPGDYGGLNRTVVAVSIELFGKEFAEGYVAIQTIAEAQQQGPQGRLAAEIATRELIATVMARQEAE